MKIAVSIVSYNTKDLLKDCLNNLLTQDFKDIKIYVLDNNSSDGSPEMVAKEFPKVSLFKSEKNLGFAKGQNVILKNIKEEMVLILNPDTKFSDETLGKMVSFFEENSECGIASCKIEDFEGHLQSNGGDLPTFIPLTVWLFNLEVLGSLPNLHRSEKEYYAKKREVGWVGGTFMMVRKSVFERIGYFNESFFMYFEDVELCFRAAKKNIKVMLNSEVSIKHKSGASSDDPRFNQWLGELKGLNYFNFKYFGSFYGWITKIEIYKAVVLRIIAFALTGKFNYSVTYAKIIGQI